MTDAKIINRTKFNCFIKLKQISRITPWEDIKIGEIYHIPPLIYNDRIDFIVLSKDKDVMRIKRLQDTYSQTMYRSDMTSNFIVKKWCLNEK